MIDCGRCFCLIDNDGLGYGVCEFDGVEKKYGHVCDWDQFDPSFLWGLKMFTYYIRTPCFGSKSPEIIAWSYKRNDSLIDFEDRVSGCNRTWIRDSPKYTKEQILKQRVKGLGEVRTVESEIKPSEVWSIGEKREELLRLLSI